LLNKLSSWLDAHVFVMYLIGLLCLFLYFLNPVKAHAAWVYIPVDVTKVYAQGVNAANQAYTIPSSPIGTMVFDTVNRRFVDIATLTPLNQPPLNPDMLGLPVVSYGGFTGFNEQSVITGIKEVLPFFMLALLSGFVAAFAPAYLLKFLRGALNSNKGVS